MIITAFLIYNVINLIYASIIIKKYYEVFIMDALWKNTTDLPDYESLKSNINVDIAIIGGGLAGILTAYKLKEKGLNAVIFEADKICSGTTGYTTGKISLAHGLIYNYLIDNFSLEQAVEYADCNKKAINEYEELINKENIDCEFEKCSSYLYSALYDYNLKEEFKAAKKCNLECEYLEESELPKGIKGAIKYKNQGKFNPLKFVKHIIKDLKIYEHTFIKEFDEQNKLLTTDKGYKVKADKIVFACHYPFVNSPGYYFLRMHQERSYFLICENKKKLKNIYLNVDEKGYSFRSYDKYLLFGGEKHRTGGNKEGYKYNLLREKLKTFDKNYNEVGHYSTQDCMSIDKVPYIGLFSDSLKDIYVLTGFNKWGMTSSMFGSDIIADMISNGLDNKNSIFCPSRFDTKGVAKSAIKEGPYSIKGLSKEFLNIPNTELDKLLLGHGGVVKYNGKKVGVYKDEDGKCYIVSTKCPHLGCELSWNPDEKSWDCPCHGSRFDYMGNIINDPSVENLEFIEKKQ